MSERKLEFCEEVIRSPRQIPKYSVTTRVTFKTVSTCFRRVRPCWRVAAPRDVKRAGRNMWIEDRSRERKVGTVEKGSRV